LNTGGGEVGGQEKKGEEKGQKVTALRASLSLSAKVVCPKASGAFSKKRRFPFRRYQKMVRSVIVFVSQNIVAAGLRVGFLSSKRSDVTSVRPYANYISSWD